MNLMKMGAKFLRVIGKNAPFIISAAAGIGLVALYILTIKETEEAQEVLAETPEEEIHEFETVKKVAKIYAPSFLCLVVTLFCIVSSAVISHHRIRDLTAYAATVTTAYHQYRQHNILQNGKEADEKILSEVTRENVKEECKEFEDGIQCLMPGYPHFFNVPNLTKIYSAIDKANIRLEDSGPGIAKFEDFWKNVGAKGSMDPRYLGHGWTSYDLTSNYGVSMLHPNLYLDTDDISGSEYWVIDIPMPRPLDTLL